MALSSHPLPEIVGRKSPQLLSCHSLARPKKGFWSVLSVTLQAPEKRLQLPLTNLNCFCIRSFFSPAPVTITYPLFGTPLKPTGSHKETKKRKTTFIRSLKVCIFCALFNGCVEPLQTFCGNGDFWSWHEFTPSPGLLYSI